MQPATGRRLTLTSPRMPAADHHHRCNPELLVSAVRQEVRTPKACKGVVEEDKSGQGATGACTGDGRWLRPAEPCVLRPPPPLSSSPTFATRTSTALSARAASRSFPRLLRCCHRGEIRRGGRRDHKGERGHLGGQGPLCRAPGRHVPRAPGRGAHGWADNDAKGAIPCGAAAGSHARARRGQRPSFSGGAAHRGTRRRR